MLSAVYTWYFSFLLEGSNVPSIFLLTLEYKMFLLHLLLTQHSCLFLILSLEVQTDSSFTTSGLRAAFGFFFTA